MRHCAGLQKAPRGYAREAALAPTATHWVGCIFSKFIACRRIRTTKLHSKLSPRAHWHVDASAWHRGAASRLSPPRISCGHGGIGVLFHHWCAPFIMHSHTLSPASRVSWQRNSHSDPCPLTPGIEWSESGATPTHRRSRLLHPDFPFIQAAFLRSQCPALFYCPIRLGR